jgi:pyruvate dehydrogenase E1 component
MSDRQFITGPIGGPQAAVAVHDCNPIETQAVIISLEQLVYRAGGVRMAYLLKQLECRAKQLGAAIDVSAYSANQNTISQGEQTVHPRDVVLEERITAINRWNALVIAVRGNKAYARLGRHIVNHGMQRHVSKSTLSPSRGLTR